MKPNKYLFKSVLLVLVALQFAPFSFCQTINTQSYASVGQDIARSFERTTTGYVFGGTRVLIINWDGSEVNDFYDNQRSINFVKKDSGFIATINASQKVTFINKYDRLGNQQWSRRYRTGHWSNTAEHAVALDDGSFLYTGRHHTVTGTGAVLRKLNDSGNMVWENKWNVGSGDADNGGKIFMHSKGVAILGNSNVPYSGLDNTRDVFVQSYAIDTANRSLWNFLYVRDSIQDGADILEIGDDKFFLLVNSSENISTDGFRGQLLKLSVSQRQAKLDWRKEYLSKSQEKLVSIKQIGVNDYIILGNRWNNNKDSIRMFVRRIDSLGNITKEFVFSQIQPKQVGVNLIKEKNGNFTIGGHALDLAGYGDYFILHFNITDLNSSSIKTTNQLNAVNVYPNPTVSNTFTVIPNKLLLGTIKVVLIDAQGKVCLQKEVNAQNRISINTNALVKGVYVLRLMADEFNAYSKVQVN